MSDLAGWEDRFRRFIEAGSDASDAAHDLYHVIRVVRQAKELAAVEGADPAVVVPAAWLHDCVSVPKNSPERHRASRMAAAEAGDFLRQTGYPGHLIDPIRHAIAAHSFSAGIPAETLEARVVQDADRLDALGAVGIARTLMLGATMGLPLYDSAEPIPLARQPDDSLNTIDHFYVKLLKLPAMMQTDGGRAEAERRIAVMEHFLEEIARETGQQIETVQPKDK